MVRLKLRIGVKLAISAGLGIVLVGAIIANEQLSGASIGLATETALDRLSVQAEALAVEGALRGMRLANRDVRLAVTAAEVDTALATLQANQADAGRRVEETFRFARSGLSEYAAATIEIAAARKEMFKTEQIQVEAAAKWTKAFEAFRASPALTGLPNRRDVEFDLHHANLSLVDALLSFWRYRMDFDPAHAKQTLASLQKTAEQLKHARGLGSDKAFFDAIDELTAIGKAYGESVVTTQKAVEKAGKVQKDQATPARQRVEAQIAAAIAAAVRSANESKAEAIAAMAAGSRIGLGIGLLVVILLIGSTLFSMLNVARPIRRIGEVLIELANGNKGVAIPYADRRRASRCRRRRRGRLPCRRR